MLTDAETPVIVYQNPEGSICFMFPSGIFDPYETALKDVPEGFPFKIISKQDYHEELDYMGAWETDFSAPDGYGIGHGNWYSQNHHLIEEAWEKFHGHPMPENILHAHNSFVSENITGVQ